MIIIVKYVLKNHLYLMKKQNIGVIKMIYNLDNYLKVVVLKYGLIVIVDIILNQYYML